MPYSGAHNSDGEGECRERRRETLLVALLSEPPVIAPRADRRLAFLMASMAGARRTFGPAVSYYLKTIEGASQFFCDWGNRFPMSAFSACRTGLSPHPPTPLVGPSLKSPGEITPGLFDFGRATSKPFPSPSKSLMPTLTFARVHSYGSEGRSCASLCPYPTQQPLLMGVGGKLH